MQTSIHPHVVRDLAQLRQGILRSVPDAAALILTGSFAHGEGAFRETNAGLQPVNDYDVVVVAREEPDQDALEQTGGRLARRLGMRGVDILGVGLHRFAWLPPSIFNYDLRHAGQVFYGDAGILELLPDWDASDIPLIEAQVILLNRMVCLLECVVEGPGAPEHGPEAQGFVAYQTAKAAFALADAAALLHGNYAIRYQEKVVLLRSQTPAGSEARQLVEAACRFRAELDLAALDMPVAHFWQRTRHAVLAAFRYVMNWMYAAHRPFEDFAELGRFLANFNVTDPRRAAIEAAQYLTLAAWDPGEPDERAIALAREFLARIDIAVPDSEWPSLRRTVVSAWFRYCH